MKVNEKPRKRAKAASRESRKRKTIPTKNGKPKNGHKHAAKKLVVEMRGGEPYEYYPLGKYVVAAPGVCGGRPTFKYTRIDVHHILDAMAAGWSVERVVDFYQRDEVSVAAVREALGLASQALLKTSSVTALAA
jgi:uncharacterized protein (DUF433 family)